MLLLQTLALQSFTSTCPSSGRRPTDKDSPCSCAAPCDLQSHPLQGMGGHSCNKHLSCAAVPSLSLGAQSNRSHCSVLCANVQTDPQLPFKKRSRSLLMGRCCSCSLCNSPGQRPSSQSLCLK